MDFNVYFYISRFNFVKTNFYQNKASSCKIRNVTNSFCEHPNQILKFQPTHLHRIFKFFISYNTSSNPNQHRYFHLQEHAFRVKYLQKNIKNTNGICNPPATVKSSSPQTHLYVEEVALSLAVAMRILIQKYDTRGKGSLGIAFVEDFSKYLLFVLNGNGSGLSFL